MTQEEKARAYDEALERAKTLYENANGMILKKWVEQVFPELAESEDEKIRKEILSFCQNRADNYPNDPKYANIGSWISWLERQGGEKDSLSIDFVLGYLGIKPAYKDGNAWCILLGDNIQEGICGFGDTKEEALIAFMKELIEKQGEKKPVEENKGNIGGISPNWSEEDEKIINGLIDSLTRISLNTRTDSTSPNYSFYREIDWLKSLRPQSRWKPSDKQMEVLWFYAEQNDYDGAVLTSLYNDLKKLKEE